MPDPRMKATPVPDTSLDTLGLYCPVPILKTARKMKELAVGQVLEVLSDDPVILEDMPAWCRSNGHEYLGCGEPQSGSPSVLRILVRKLR